MQFGQSADKKMGHDENEIGKSNALTETHIDTDKRRCKLCHLQLYESHGKFIFHPRDQIKIAWDIMASVVLVAACFMTPLSLAFETLDEA